MSPAPGRRAELESIFRQALASVDAAAAVRRCLGGDAAAPSIVGRPVPPPARVVLLAAGKAAAPMAAAFEERAAERVRAGLAVTKDGHGQPLTRTRLLEAAHPVPDARSQAAAREAVQLVEGAAPDDVLLVLLSGGASSLLAGPAPGLELADLAGTTRLLLEAGADIGELNAVRKHLSSVAGGRLARHARAARIEVLAISDVPGDRLDVIGSGPFAPDPTTFADALAALRDRGVLEQVPVAARRHLEAGARGDREETPKPGESVFERVRTTLLATNRTAVEAASREARRRRLPVRVVSQTLRGEARREARRLVGLARAVGTGPLLLVAGGETVVTVRGPGKGGPNQELALAAALELDAGPPTALLAAGTDGTDGPTAAAGAYADEGTLARGRRAGVDATAALAANDAHGFFAAEGGLFTTGPTGTNVMDLVLLRVGQ